MEVPRGMVTDSVVTVDDTCRMSCEVLNEQIEFRFGDHTGGLHLFLDWEGYVKFVKLQAEVVERFFTLPPGAPIKFLVGDDGEERNKS
jgi:hypothetical protein